MFDEVFQVHHEIGSRMHVDARKLLLRGGGNGARGEGKHDGRLQRVRRGPTSLWYKARACGPSVMSPGICNGFPTAGKAPFIEIV